MGKHAERAQGMFEGEAKTTAQVLLVVGVESIDQFRRGDPLEMVRISLFRFHISFVGQVLQRFLEQIDLIDRYQ